MNNLDKVKQIAWYRAKNKKDEWCHGFITCDLKGNARIYNSENEKAMFQEVKIGTIGRDIGIKDTNGVSIFEGDVVKISYKGRNKFGIIESLGYEFSIKDGNNMYWKITSVPLEVIGNIHDNPELVVRRNNE